MSRIENENTEAISTEEGVTVYAGRVKKGGHFKASAFLSHEALAALGYVPKPVWRDAVNDLPPHSGYFQLAQKDRETGREFICEEKFAHGGWQIHPAFQALYWYPLPALPGKEEA